MTQEEILQQWQNTDVRQILEERPEFTDRIIDALELLGYTVKRPVREVHDEYTFERAWQLYQKKVGDKKALKNKWNRLSLRDRKAIIEYIPLYVASEPRKQYRKNFQTFLNQHAWQDEIIEKEPTTDPQPSTSSSLIEQTREQMKQWSLDAKDKALRQRILGMIQVLQRNPQSLCRGQLVAYHHAGTLTRLGIQWQP